MVVASPPKKHTHLRNLCNTLTTPLYCPVGEASLATASGDTRSDIQTRSKAGGFKGLALVSNRQQEHLNTNNSQPAQPLTQTLFLHI